jgi:hypothetical protein
MALSQVGNAAGEGAHDAGSTRHREPSVPQRTDSDDSLLDAIRRALVPVDPIARLLALWPAPPVRAVRTSPARRTQGLPST